MSELIIVCCYFSIMSDEENFEVKLETAPFDARFPYTNQTKNCWQNYVDFHKCSKKIGEEHKYCHFFKKVYMSLCPSKWVGTMYNALHRRYNTGMQRYHMVLFGGSLPVILWVDYLQMSETTH